MKYTFKPSELTKESSLWDVYILTRVISINTFDFWFTIFISLLLFVNSVYLSSSMELIQSIRQWVPFVFGFTTTTLGFLITGFTIFATINKPDLFLALMNIKHPTYDMSFLKYIYGVFMRVFIQFIFWSIVYLIIIMFGQDKGLITKVAKAIMLPHEVKVFVVQISYIAVGASSIFLVLSIKTFLFNIYTMLMQSLRWEMNNIEQQARGNSAVENDKS